MAGLLVGSAVGRYEIEDSDALKRLLARIAANRVIDLAPARVPQAGDPGRR